MTTYRALGRGVIIRYFCEQKGLTVPQLAEIVGVHRSTMSEQVSGNRPMPWPVAARIGQEFGVPPHILVEPIHDPDETKAAAS